jgi:hypothetical protein
MNDISLQTNFNISKKKKKKPTVNSDEIIHKCQAINYILAINSTKACEHIFDCINVHLNFVPSCDHNELPILVVITSKHY